MSDNVRLWMGAFKSMSDTERGYGIYIYIFFFEFIFVWVEQRYYQEGTTTQPPLSKCARTVSFY